MQLMFDVSVVVGRSWMLLADRNCLLRVPDLCLRVPSRLAVAIAPISNRILAAAGWSFRPCGRVLGVDSSSGPSSRVPRSAEISLLKMLATRTSEWDAAIRVISATSSRAQRPLFRRFASLLLEAGASSSCTRSSWTWMRRVFLSQLQANDSLIRTCKFEGWVRTLFNCVVTITPLVVPEKLDNWLAVLLCQFPALGWIPDTIHGPTYGASTSCPRSSPKFSQPLFNDSLCNL